MSKGFIMGGAGGENVSAEVNAQESLIEQIQAALEGKAASKIFAVIGVTYPEGSTCTCTDGIKEFTAKDTSGQCVFVIPYVGTWTVSCTDGEDVAEKVVEIIAEGQSVSVELRYKLVLFDGTNGGDNEGITGGWALSNGTGSVSVSDSEIYIDVTSSQGTTYAAVTKNKIDVTEYSTLYVVGRFITYRWTNPSIGLYDNVTRGDYSCAASFEWSPTDSDYVTKVLDIGSVEGEYHIGSKGSDPYFVIQKIWLEI